MCLRPGCRKPDVRIAANRCVRVLHIALFSAELALPDFEPDRDRPPSTDLYDWPTNDSHLSVAV